MNLYFPMTRSLSLSTLATALLLSAGSMCSSQAAVIYSGVQNISIPTTTLAGVYLDVETGTSSTSTIAGWDVNFFLGGMGEYNAAGFQPVRTSSGDSFSPIINLAVDALVNGSSVFSNGVGGSEIDHVGSGASQFQPSAPGYLGFMLSGLGGPKYGWMRVTFTLDEPGALIHDWAYDDTGGGILVGSLIALPEPSRAVLLILGLTGLVCRRRRVG